MPRYTDIDQNITNHYLNTSKMQAEYLKDLAEDYIQAVDDAEDDGYDMVTEIADKMQTAVSDIVDTLTLAMRHGSYDVY